jgi:hypothetical protein
VSCHCHNIERFRAQFVGADPNDRLNWNDMAFWMLLLVKALTTASWIETRSGV